MRHLYIVTYDVSEPKRLRQVFKALKGYGDHLQLSVFRCELALAGLIRLKADLLEVIHCREDQVLILDLGPAEGRGDVAVESLGRDMEEPGDGAVIV